MKESELKAITAKGEDSRLQFKKDIRNVDDRDGCLFTAAVHRKEMVGSEKSSEKILSLLKTEPELAAREIGRRIGVSSRAVEKQIANLRREGRLRRIGPAKGGRWEVQ